MICLMRTKNYAPVGNVLKDLKNVVTIFIDVWRGAMERWIVLVAQMKQIACIISVQQGAGSVNILRVILVRSFLRLSNWSFKI